MSMYEKDDFYGKYNSPSAPPLPPPHHDSSPAYSSPPPHGYPASPFDNNNKRHSLEDPDMYHQVPMMGGYQHPRNSMSDMKLTSATDTPAGYHHHHQYDTDDEEEESGLTIPKERRKRSCLDKVCCGCCVCCPRWARYCSCILLLILIAVGIVVGVLAALFKMPQVNMSGLDSAPTVNVTDGHLINMAFQLQVSVNNPNVEGITFDTIVAKAYYPQHHDIQLGGGEKDQVVIAKNAVTNFTFPFDLAIDMANPSYQAILQDLFSKCGVDGSQKQQIKIDYDVIPTVKFGLIPISITISNSASFDCPDVLTHLGGLASSISSQTSAGIS
ncbi:uncharacterized protein BX664DRAFT_335763 [Halteromyces radiatus]|uniref:uncharacterized protein n=1 Tax=Halteromyces radiatus TaxID=101107 RepID=UPI00221EA815|nr:uncharacterized protein BX664DRAFT_335763 [Halteromyces radiatus]KAI8086428.1 hypothetical protein BX664DRAFT_335763 [Halteromyces radiatus]